MLIPPLKVLFFFCLIILVLIHFCIHLIRGMFFSHRVSDARHYCGDVTGHRSLMWSVCLGSSVKVGTETEMLLCSTSTRKEDVRVPPQKYVVVEWLI